jgi:negative regulator of sigma E activity
MACEAFGEDLSAWIDGELTPAEEARLVAHLQSCPSCAELLRDFQDTSLLVRQLPVPRAPAFVADAAMDLVRATRQRTSEPWLLRARRFLFEPFFPKVSIEAVGFVAIVALAVLVGRERFTTDADKGNTFETTDTRWHTTQAPSSSAPITRSFGAEVTVRGPNDAAAQAGSEFVLPQYYDFRDPKSHGRRDVGTFDERERVAWEHGAWRQGRRFGRDGSWWEVNSAWYWYEQPTGGPPPYVSEFRFTYPLPGNSPPSIVTAPRPTVPGTPSGPAPLGPRQ